MLAHTACFISDILSFHPLVAWEYKLDGIRGIIVKSGTRVSIFSRYGNDITEQFNEIAEEVLECVRIESAILDGEIVGIDSETKKLLPPQKLRSKDNPLRREINYVAFDVLRVNDASMEDWTYSERREKLDKIIKPSQKLSIVPQIISASSEEVKKFMDQARSLSHEGLMAKSLTSTYTLGERSRDWLKLKRGPETLDLVVVGVNWGRGRRGDQIKSLLLATYGCVDNPNDKRLYTVCSVGSGIGYEVEEELKALLRQYGVGEKPDKVISKIEVDTWMEPRVVVEIGCGGVQKSMKHSAGVSLKFPRFVGIRGDKDLTEITTIERIEEMFLK